jgi:hypothetical protein
VSPARTLYTWALAWSIAVLFCVLCAFMDGEAETTMARAVAADLQQAPADERVAMRPARVAFKE